jgi:hypothetical protein
MRQRRTVRTIPESMNARAATTIARALVAVQCERGHSRDDAERRHDRGCHRSFQVKVDGFKHDGLPCRRYSSRPHPPLVVIAPAIHDTLPHVAHCDRTWA